MAQPFTLISPPTYETALTGLYLAGERTIRGKLWRAEVRTDGTTPLTCDGKALAFADAPRAAQLFRNDVVTFANKAAALQQGAKA